MTRASEYDELELVPVSGLEMSPCFGLEPLRLPIDLCLRMEAGVEPGEQLFGRHHIRSAFSHPKVENKDGC